MNLKGKIGPEEKIQAVEDYLEMRKGSTQIRDCLLYTSPSPRDRG